MNTPTRVSTMPAYNLVLYQKALHPELFQVKSRRTLKIPGGEFEAWLMPGSHVLRFQSRALCLSELVSDRDSGLPTTGAVAGFPCAGDRDFDQPFEDGRVNYVTSVQTETLGESLYSSTFAEITELSREIDGLTCKWDAEAGRCLSVLDIQRYPNEVHVQSYHLAAAGGLVVRTQTIFEYR
jgi:hypothetical protein